MKLAIIFTLLSLSLVTTTAQARTLQSLAQLSNALLAQADKPTCKLTSQQISEKSQSLQSMIDEKSAKLTEGDFKILNGRAETCSTDCTCDIYAYALEKREHPNKMISDKATKTQMADRQKCSAQVKNLCAQIKAL
ncbi:hypothetical protein CIK05_05790 [Bdellovibrio sp. qaytius]|nr:hypothetical protein CIK05_05790 [Bdellovibrio sp. qaytius]